MADNERSLAGRPIYRYTESKSGKAAPVDLAARKKISEHIEAHAGPIDGVLHEIVSDVVHIDVNFVPPDQTKPDPSWLLVTSGMSDRPMKAPEGNEDWQYAELLMHLPADWPVNDEAFSDDRHYWPVEWLKRLARLPHEYDTWLSWGHTVPNGDPPEPLSPETQMCCMLLLHPLLLAEQIYTLEAAPGKIIHFFQVIPVYREEMQLTLDKGTDAFIERFGSLTGNDLMNFSRQNLGV
ncbi:MAG TPA: suppressor of fused domain protein [Planctomycetota bacterium]|jgi:hypothetical protein